MTVTTTSQLTAPVNVVYQTQLLRRAQMVLPYFIGTTPASITSNSGTFTAKWRRYEHLTPVTTALTEITGSLNFPTRTPVQPTITDVTATVSKYGNFIFLNEEVNLLNITDNVMELTGVLGENAGRSLNRLQRNEAEDNATQTFSGQATTATAINGAATASGFISRTNIANVVNTLERNDGRKFMPMTRGSTNIGTAPVRESFWGITHPDVGEDIRLLTGFQSVETYAGQTETESGEIGHIGGVRFIVSSESTIDTTLGATLGSTSATTDGRATGARYDRYNVVFMARDAVGSLGLDATHVKEVYRPEDNLPAVMLISHAKGSAGTADPLNEVASIGWKSWHAAKILNSSWVRTLVCAASRLS